jgi:uncharacterized protein
MVDKSSSPYFPGRAPIDAYGNGGFRFADMSHRGALIMTASGVFGAVSATPDELALEALARLKGEAEYQTVLLLGTGRAQMFPSAATRKAFAEAGIGLEAMDTGAAARTYNVLLVEKRPVAAALLAVD